MPEPQYRVFIRVPINRGDFVDPPPVNWDSTKDEALWRILSKVAKTQINWTDLAARFEVTVDFLLRQVAYLTEQHASQVRDELRKAAAAAKGSAAPSPIPGAEPGAGHQRTASALSARKDSPFQPSGTGTPVEPSFRPNVSRNSSGNSPAYSHNLGGGSTPRPTKEAPRPGETLAQRQRLSSLPMSSSPNPPSPGPADSSSSSGDSDDSSPAQSRIIRRPPRFQSQDEPRDYGDDDDDVEPAFQALDHGSSDMNATVRGDEKTTSKGANRGKGRLHKSQTSDSSTGSSAAMVPRQHKSGGRPVSGPISPRAAQLAGRSPGGKNKDASREGSDGTPSMGSSFSDLDDSSVTQSAMAEALAAGIQDGGIGSRLSLAQSLSRRFVPRRGN